MNIQELHSMPKTIVFKSQKDFFDIEEDGTKPYTIRELDEKEAKDVRECYGSLLYIKFELDTCERRNFVRRLTKIDFNTPFKSESGKEILVFHFHKEQ